MPARSTKGPAAEAARSLAALSVPAIAISDALLETDGRQITVESRGGVTQTEAEGLARQFRGGMLVADRISAAARQILADGGVAWLDRRGHLQLRGRSVLIDADVPPLIPPQPTRVTDVFVPTGLDVGMALLLDPKRGHRTTEVATLIGRSPGRVSEILTALRDRGLIDSNARPAIPDLFDEMADAWAPRWQPVGTLPHPDAEVFRLSGTLGAVAQRAPVVATADWPAELYVEDQGELRTILRAHGTPAGTPAVGRVAACPSRYGWSVPAPLSHQGYVVANHVVIALDLAQDRGRGREILEGWQPEDHDRVW